MPERAAATAQRGATRRIRSLAGKLRSPAPLLDRLLGAEGGAARWAVEIPALTVGPFQPLAERAGSAHGRDAGEGPGARSASGDGSRGRRDDGGGGGAATPHAGSGGSALSPAAGWGAALPRGSQEGTGQRGTAPSPAAQPSPAAAPERRGAHAPVAELQPATQAGKPVDGTAQRTGQPTSDRPPVAQPRRRVRPVRTGAQPLSAAASAEAPVPALESVTTGTAGRSSPGGRRGTPGTPSGPVAPVDDIPDAVPEARWLGLLDTLSSRALERHAPGRRSEGSGASTPPVAVEDERPSPAPTFGERQLAETYRGASILRPDRRDHSRSPLVFNAPPWRRGVAESHPDIDRPAAPTGETRHRPGASPDPTVIPDAADIADLVNAALIEQARRHGVDLI